VRRLLPLALTVAVACVVTGPASGAPALPTASCWTPGGSAPVGCAGWFTTDVTVTWSYDPAGVTATDCDVVTVSADTAGASVTCRVWYGSDYVEAGKVIRRDATPPAVTGAAAERAPDWGEWFNHPVAVGFTGTDATSGIAACAGATYSGPDTATASVAGTCRDVAGNTSSGSFSLRYDSTPPTVAAVAARAPDANGWYRAPVAVRFSGADALSGVASCDGPVTYGGPETARAAVSGSCRDAAGNAGAPAALTLRYDSKPPAAAGRLRVETGSGFTRVRWARSPSARLYELVRIPGLGSASRSTVYRGRKVSFLDRAVRNGVRYRYLLRSLDEAGNAAARTIAALPRAPVFAPAAGTVLRAPPRAAWEDVAGARFYNVQLYHGTTKVLSAWVVEPRLRLTRAWTYDGRRRTLANGAYRLFVWPAFGTRKQPRYGKLLGETTFRVRRS
jgi:hypothetical protein